MRPLAYVDFETKGIEPRPRHPPLPVGFAVIAPGRYARGAYLAWGHPTGNNASRQGARDVLVELYQTHDIVCHNAAFDLDVAYEHMGLPMPAWGRYHDTLIEAFLHNPRAHSLSLKPLAASILGLPPEEQDELKDWICANIPEARRKKSEWGAHIWRAPVPLVGRYAIGDVKRTKKLHEWFQAYLREWDLLDAYDRERQLLPILLRMERRGVAVDVRRLGKDIKTFQASQLKLEQSLRRRLKVPRVMSDSFVFSGEQLANALERSGKVDPERWVRTEKGARSTSAEALRACCTDPELIRLLDLHSVVETCVHTFMEPWHAVASGPGNGRIFTQFNQVRGERGGTRTGRLSSTPNFQNIPTVETSKKFGAGLVPNVRDYIVPTPGTPKRILVKRDYSQQELRIFAHYEQGVFSEAYAADPTMDGHELTAGLIKDATGIVLPRKPVKNLNFGAIYGLGVAGLAFKLGCGVNEARDLKRAHQRAMPGVKDMYDEMRQRAKTNTPIRTWGGRLYWCEPDKYDEKTGRVRQFDYKLVNYLIQGSAADCTKQAMINYADAIGSDWDTAPLEMQVHDELVAECPYTLEADTHALMREAMLAVDFDVPMLSDGESSERSWARLRKAKEA